MWIWSVYNRNDSGYYVTKEDAINAAKASGFLSFYVLECEIVPLKTDVDPDRIMQELDESFRDDTNCEDYIYEGVSDGDRKWLKNKLSELMQEFNKKIKLESNFHLVYSGEHINLNKCLKEE